MKCICSASRQDPFRLPLGLLQDERFIIGFTCRQCGAQSISITLHKQMCSICAGNMDATVQHIICREHSCRGPESIWVNQKMIDTKIPCPERTVDHYVQKLKNREPFTHARYGDGDWLTILGYYGRQNSNGCIFTKELSEAVRQVLRNEYDYDHALLSRPNRRFGMHIREFLENEGIGLEFVSEWILSAMLEGRLFPLFEQIRNYRALYVGPHRIDDKGFFPLEAHIIPLPQNSFDYREETVDAILHWIEMGNVDFIGWSCGGGSKPMIDDIFAKTNGEITQIDFGSTFDGYFPPLPHVNPKGSRSFIRKGNRDWAELLRKNTEGESR